MTALKDNQSLYLLARNPLILSLIALFGRVLERSDLPRQKAAVRALGRIGARAGDPMAAAARLRTALGAEAASLGQGDAETVTALERARQDDVPAIRAAAL